jgi:hypothetical protein
MQMMMQIECATACYAEMHVPRSSPYKRFDIWDRINELLGSLVRTLEAEGISDSGRIHAAVNFLESLRCILAPGRFALKYIEMCQMNPSIAIIPDRLRYLTMRTPDDLYQVMQ